MSGTAFDTYVSTITLLTVTPIRLNMHRSTEAMMSATAPHPTDTSTWVAQHDPLPIVAWRDPVIDAAGFDPRSDYVETYWLAVLGPSCILAGRRFADWLETCPSGIEIALEDLARSLGLGGGTGRHAAVIRTLDRLVSFGMASVTTDALAARLAYPPLARRQLARLPGYLADRHATDLNHHLDALSTAPPRR